LRDSIHNQTDEIQVIGGGSWLKFVWDAIKESAGTVPVRRDFQASEAIAYGCVYHALTNKEFGIPETQVFIRPPLSVNISCNGSDTVYCVRGEGCAREVNTTGLCPVLELVAEPADVPEGATTVLSTYLLTELEKWEDGATLRLNLTGGRPYLLGISVCPANGSDCEPANYSMKERPWEKDDAPDAQDLVPAMTGTEDAKRVAEPLLYRMKRLFEPLIPIFENSDDLKIEGGDPEEWEATATKVLDWYDQFLNGQLDWSGGPGLRGIIRQLEDISTRLGIKLPLESQ
jgi:hypothetical protein